MVQKIDISQVTAQSSGALNVTELGVVVEKPIEDIEHLSGQFDASSGSLTLEIPGIGSLRVTGFPNANDLGQGSAGIQGKEGRSGIDGLSGSNGRRGADGCEGPRGQDGPPGRQGPRGLVGPIGATGPTGPTGRDGEDGKMAIYISEEDPIIAHGMTLPVGAIWVKP